jgi:signal transduction histidine kinase
MTAIPVTRPPLTEGNPPFVSAEPRRMGRLRALLGVPLVTKLLGANLATLLAVGAIAVRAHFTGSGETLELVLLIAVLVMGFLVNLMLVRVAVRPLRELELTAARVAAGDLDAIAVPSPIYDQQLTRIGGALNMLVSGLRADRLRMHRLATQVIRAQDEERARIARELHDSTAQTLAALQLQLSAAAREIEESGGPPELNQRLAALRDLATGAVEEVRLLSHTVYPRILDDLGLPAALEWLARRAREQDGLEVRFEYQGEGELAPQPAAALYRVAQEAIRNAVRHARASEVVVRLTLHGRLATLEVQDDGTGFDIALAEHRRPGMGLFSMRERVALVDGSFAVDSGRGRGTCVRAEVSLETPNHE